LHEEIFGKFIQTWRVIRDRGVWRSEAEISKQEPFSVGGIVSTCRKFSGIREK